MLSVLVPLFFSLELYAMEYGYIPQWIDAYMMYTSVYFIP